MSQIINWISSRLDQNTEIVFDAEQKKKATFWDIYLLGMMTVSGGQFFAWNSALDEGVWCFLSAVILTGLGYLCLTLCLAEMTSALPFSGGLYGFVRVTTNPFWGFVVAVCEVFQSVFFISVCVLYMGQLVREAMDAPHDHEIVVWVMFFVTALGLQISGGQIFLTWNRVLGGSVVFIIVLYLFLSPIDGDFDKYARRHDDFAVIEVLQRFPMASWMFLGVEYIPLFSVYCAKPRQDVPRAMVYCIITLLITSLFIVIAMNSNHPGTEDIVTQLNPMNYVFQKNLGIKHLDATWFTVVAVYGTAYGFLFAQGRKLQSMANSGMIPAIFKQKVEATGVPYVALLFGALCSFMVIIPVVYGYTSFQEDLYFWCVIGSFFTYVCAFVSFIELRRKYGILDRSFINPWGIPAAVIGLAVFTITFISTVAFQDMRKSYQHRVHPIAGFSIFFVFAMLWYYFYAQKHQCFSSDEQKIMFSAYVIKSNIKAKQRMKKSRKMQRSNSFYSRSDRSTSDHNTSSRQQHSINSSANSDSEDASSHPDVETGVRTTDSIRSVNINGAPSPANGIAASHSLDSSDNNEKSARRKETNSATASGSNSGSNSFRIPGSRSKDKDQSSSTLMTSSSSSKGSTQKEGGSFRITQRENGSLRIVHQERSVRIIDTAIPENSPLVPSLDPLNGGAMAPVEDVEACKFHRREVVHDSTIEGIKTLGLVLGKTTNQASKVISNVAPTLFSQSPVGMNSQKVLVVPVDTEGTQPVTDEQQFTKGMIDATSANEDMKTADGGDIERGLDTDNPPLSPHQSPSLPPLSSSPLSGLKNAMLGVVTGRRASIDEEEENFGGRATAKGRSRHVKAKEGEGELVGIVPNYKPTFIPVPKPVGANPNPMPILPNYANGQMLDAYGYGQTCVVDSSSVNGKRGLWQGLSAFDEAVVQTREENPQPDTFERSKDKESDPLRLYDSGVGDVLLVGGSIRQDASPSRVVLPVELSEGEAAVDEAVYGDKEAKEERERERMLLGSRNGGERAQLGSRSNDKPGGLLATLNLERERNALGSRGGIRWSADAFDTSEGGIDPRVERTGTISRMSFSLKFDVDNSLPLFEDDDLPVRWPFAPLPLPLHHTEDGVMNSGRLSEPSELNLGEGDLGSLAGEGDMGSLAEGSYVEGGSVVDGDNGSMV